MNIFDQRDGLEGLKDFINITLNLPRFGMRMELAPQRTHRRYAQLVVVEADRIASLGHVGFGQRKDLNIQPLSEVVRLRRAHRSTDHGQAGIDVHKLATIKVFEPRHRE